MENQMENEMENAMENEMETGVYIYIEGYITEQFGVSRVSRDENPLTNPPLGTDSGQS